MGELFSLKQAMGGLEFGVDIGRSQKAIVTDFVEAGRQDVQEKAADELKGRDRHDMVALGDEGNGIAVHGDEPVIGDGDPVRVSAKIPEDLVRAAERSFCIDVPVQRIEGIEKIVGQARGGMGLPVGVLEFSLGIGLLKSMEKLAAEEGSDDFDGKQVPGPFCGYPLETGGVESSGGNDTMKMGMKPEISGPGVQDAGDAEQSAEAIVVGAQAEKGLSGGFKEDIKDTLWVGQSQGSGLSRQGEDDVEIMGGQDTSRSLCDPSSLWQALTLGAVTVSAGVVRRPLVAAVKAGVQMSAEHRGAACQDGTKRPVLLRSHSLFFDQGLTVVPEDVGDLEGRPVEHRDRAGSPAAFHPGLSQGGTLGGINKVQGASCLTDMCGA